MKVYIRFDLIIRNKGNSFFVHFSLVENAEGNPIRSHKQYVQLTSKRPSYHGAEMMAMKPLLESFVKALGYEVKGFLRGCATNEGNLYYALF